MDIKYTIDRFEGAFAILLSEEGESFAVPAALLSPLDAKEGDVLTLAIDKEQTASREQEAKSKLHALFARSAETDPQAE